MSIEQVLFSVPSYVQAGLASGQYERIGGVIRQSESKEIVAWLREGASTQAQDVNNLLGSMTVARALSVANVAGLMMNLSLTAITLTEIKKASSQIIDLAEQLQIERDEQKQDKFNTAIDAFDDMLNAQNPQIQHDRGMISIQRFEELVQEFTRNFEAIIEENIEQASFYLQQAILTASYRSRAYIQLHEANRARQYINRDIENFNIATSKLVDALIGAHPAIFFHKDVEASDVQRFVDVMESRKGISLMDVLNDVRGDFWNTRIINEPFHRRLPGIPKSRNFIDEIPTRLDQIEFAIENHNRLVSIEMELRYLRLTNQSYAEWNDKVSEADLDQHKVAILHLSESIALESE